jgi:hypothetical protein
MKKKENFSFKKKIRNTAKKFLYYNTRWYKGKYLAIQLQGGLCNKLHCLISACDIAINKKSFLIEPDFGWKRKILFSDIYDLDYFNLKMSEFTNNNELIVSREKSHEKSVKEKSVDNVIDLWEYSIKKLSKQRETGRIKKDETKLKVLKALKLKPDLQKIVDSYTLNKKFTALQVRTESDWVSYAKVKKAAKDEKILVTLEGIITMLSNFEIVGELFFTSGQNHLRISEEIKKLGINPEYIYNPDYEYEINAAINFEICSQAELFIGLSRSTFSNLISLKRAVILNNDKSFIYNYKDKIIRRQDKGLQMEGDLAVTKKTDIV